MYCKTIVKTAPLDEPVCLTEVKAQLRVTHDMDDEHIVNLIYGARKRAEQYCNRFFTQQEVYIVYEGDICTPINIPYPDIKEVLSISYVDQNDDKIIIGTDEYKLNDQLSKISPVTQFPKGASSYTVEVATSPPVDIEGAKIAILMMVTDLYMLRTETVVGVSVDDNPAVMAHLWPYRVSLGV